MTGAGPDIACGLANHEHCRVIMEIIGVEPGCGGVGRVALFDAAGTAFITGAGNDTAHRLRSLPLHRWRFGDGGV